MSTIDELALKLDALLAREATPKRFLGVNGASDYSSLSVKTLRRMIASRRLTAFRPAKGKILIDRVELDTVILSASAPVRTGRGIA